MSKVRFAGFCLQLAGKTNEIWGELTGDSRRAAVGRRDQVIGTAQQVSAIEQEQAARQQRRRVPRISRACPCREFRLSSSAQGGAA